MSTELMQQTAHVIQTNFAQTPYPGDEKVAAYARYGRTIADSLRGKHWSEVPLDVMVRHRWEIFLLTPVTFRFYAPSFMLATLMYYDQMDTLPDNLLFSLTPQRQEHINNYFAGELNDYFSRRAAAFNTEEKAAILAFVEAYAQLYPLPNRLYDVDLSGVTIPFWRQA